MEINTANPDTPMTTELSNCRECGTLEHLKLRHFKPKDKTIPDLFYFIYHRCDIYVEFNASLSQEEAIEAWNERQRTVVI